MHGVGPWTADIYLLFCLGHADAFPAGDLAVQESGPHRLSLCASAPTPKALTKLAEAWRPWRGVAAHLLWAYYHAVKRREGVSLDPAAQTKKRAKASGTKKRRRKRSKGKSGMAESMARALRRARANKVDWRLLILICSLY